VSWKYPPPSAAPKVKIFAGKTRRSNFSIIDYRIAYYPLLIATSKSRLYGRLETLERQREPDPVEIERLQGSRSDKKVRGKTVRSQERRFSGELLE